MPEQRKNSIRFRLLAERESLRSRYGRIQRDFGREAEPLVADAPDQAVQRGNDEVLLEIEESA